MTENSSIRLRASMLMALIAACFLLAAAHAPDAGALESNSSLSGKTIVLDCPAGGPVSCHDYIIIVV
jgi:hypothetical protein